MKVRIREKLDRETWLKWRGENINASEIGAMVGVHDYYTKLQLYHEKKSGLTKEQTRAMERGLDMESAILAMVTREKPHWRIEPCKHYYDIPEHRIGCSPDAFVWSEEWEGHANLQLKLVARPVFEQKWQQEDGGFAVPIYYQVQTLTEAKLTRAARNFIAAYVIETFARDGVQDLFIQEIPIHEGAWAAVTRSTAAFWHDFDAGIEPAVEPERDNGFIKRLYPTEDGSIVDLTGDNELPEALEAYRRLSAQLSEANKPVAELEKQRKGWATLIQAKLGSASGGILPGWEITWKEQQRKACQFRQLRVKQVGAR